MKTAKKVLQRQNRKRRIRAKIVGTSKRPRLSVYRSLTKITTQLIDDSAGVTIVSAQSQKRTVENALELGKEIAKKAKEKKINECVFDRNGFSFHGCVKAVADGARAEGLKF